MPRYNVTIDVEVEADNQEQAWELVAIPFHNGSIRNDQPHWLHPLVSEPELLEVLQVADWWQFDNRR